MKCPSCGNEISDNLNICPICGLKIRYNPNETAQTVYTNKKSFNPLSFFTGFILAAIIGCAGYYGYTMFQDGLGKNGTYQSITPMEKTTVEYLSSKEVLENNKFLFLLFYH